jgi:chromosomal replication initiation ATPase DnaA
VVDQARVLWQTCAELLTTQVSEAVWQTSFRSVRPVELSTDTLTLAVPSSVVKERIEGRYLELVKGAVADAGSPDVEVLLVVRTDEVEDVSTRILTLEYDAHPRA